MICLNLDGERCCVLADIPILNLDGERRRHLVDVYDS